LQEKNIRIVNYSIESKKKRGLQMQKNLVEPYKSQYVKIVKDTGEFLDGTIVEILDKSIIFQTEINRSAISIDSIREIIS
jgi:hypothetical protein